MRIFVYILALLILSPFYTYAGTYSIFIDQYGGNLYFGDILSESGFINITPPGFAGTIGNPDISSDGKKIVFPANIGDNWDIYIADFDKNQKKISNLVPLIQNINTADEDPRFSWDQKKIVYKERIGSTSTIKAININTKSLLFTIQNAGCELWGPAWNPIGTNIVYTQRCGDNEIFDEIYIYNTISRKKMRITKNTTPDRYPTFLANGSIIYTSTSQGGENLSMYKDQRITNLKKYTQSDADSYPIK